VRALAAPRPPEAGARPAPGPPPPGAGYGARRRPWSRMPHRVGSGSSAASSSRYITPPRRQGERMIMFEGAWPHPRTAPSGRPPARLGRVVPTIVARAPTGQARPDHPSRITAPPQSPVPRTDAQDPPDGHGFPLLARIILPPRDVSPMNAATVEPPLHHDRRGVERYARRAARSSARRHGLPEAILAGWTGSSGTSTSSTRSARGSTVWTRRRTHVSSRRSTYSRRPALGSAGRWSTRSRTRRFPDTVRILFCFDPWRSSILLVAGDKAGRWNAWYKEAIPLAEQRYKTCLMERGRQEGDRR
jgi:Phage derived protein Gp49-like (DUF891)